MPDSLCSAIFLDKDGTIIEDLPYNVDPERMRFTPGAAEGLHRLRSAGYRLIVVSNQSGVARGYFLENALEVVRDRLANMLAEVGAPLDGFYWCPHHPEGVMPGYSIHCECRKPRPDLIQTACQELGIDPSRSWLIGDKLDDVEAGRQAGCQTVLLDPEGLTPPERDAEWPPPRRPHFRASNLAEAARLILAADAQARTPSPPAPARDRPRSR